MGGIIWNEATGGIIRVEGNEATTRPGAIIRVEGSVADTQVEGNDRTTIPVLVGRSGAATQVGACLTTPTRPRPGNETGRRLGIVKRKTTPPTITMETAVAIAAAAVTIATAVVVLAASGLGITLPLITPITSTTPTSATPTSAEVQLEGQQETLVSVM